MPKEKPKVNIGEVIKSYRADRGLSQGDIERRTGLLHCYLSRVVNGHTVPSLETLAKIAEAMELSFAGFFPRSDTPQARELPDLGAAPSQAFSWPTVFAKDLRTAQESTSATQRPVSSLQWIWDDTETPQDRRCQSRQNPGGRRRARGRAVHDQHGYR